jgi:hypothetical protein
MSDERMDVILQRLQIVQCNQEIIHSQRDELLLEFPNVPVFPGVSNHYALLTTAELSTFGIGPARVSDDDDDDEEAAVGGHKIHISTANIPKFHFKI